MKGKNIKKEMMALDNIHNVVFRENGEVEVFSRGDVKNEVFRYIGNSPGLEFCFTKINFYDTKDW